MARIVAKYASQESATSREPQLTSEERLERFATRGLSEHNITLSGPDRDSQAISADLTQAQEVLAARRKAAKEKHAHAKQHASVHTKGSRVNQLAWNISDSANDAELPRSLAGRAPLKRYLLALACCMLASSVFGYIYHFVGPLILEFVGAMTIEPSAEMLDNSSGPAVKNIAPLGKLLLVAFLGLAAFAWPPFLVVLIVGQSVDSTLDIGSWQESAREFIVVALAFAAMIGTFLLF